MKIKVFCRDVDGTELAPPVKVCGKLKDAFSLKTYLDYDSEPFGFEVSVILQTAHRTIEVRKEHPQWCVCIEDPEGVLEFRPFYTDFEHGLSKCSSAYKMGLNAVLYVKTVAEGWKSWWTFNHSNGGYNGCENQGATGQNAQIHSADF